MRPPLLAALLAGLVGIAPAAGAAVPAIVSGTDYALALAQDGKLYAWGWDTRGQLGSGRALFSALPRKVPAIPPIVHMDGGAAHVAAVDWLGKVWTWGRNDAGQLGRRSISDPTRPGQVQGVGGIVRASASRSFTAALKSDGTVLVWGTFAGRLRMPETIAGLAGVVDIRSGFGHIVALKGDGTVWTVGSNDYGELGDGTAGGVRTTAAKVPGVASIVKIGAGPCGSIALKNDATVVAWGRAACAATPARYSPAPVAGLSGVADVVGGFDHSHAILTNGSVREWDNNYVPATRSGLLAVTQLAADTGLETVALLANGTVIVTGSNDLGQHAQGNTNPISDISLVDLSNVAAVATAHSGDGAITHYARASNGDLYGWGADFDSQLGQGATLVSSVPKLVSGLPALAKVAAGDTAAYAVDANGFAWAWGDNRSTQLGDATVTPRSTPAKIAGLSGVKDVAAGAGFALFLLNDGTARLLGSLAGTVNSAPAAVPGLANNIAAVAARGRNAYAIAMDGSVMGWGAGQDGLVGDGSTTDRALPVALTAFGAPVTSISAGPRHALARAADGGVWSWGTDVGTGALGDGVKGIHTQPTPTRVLNIAGATAVAAGDGHSLALLAGGLVSSWGSGPLGDGPTDSRNVPGPVRTLTGATSIAAGRYASWAVGADGAAYAWGGTLPRGTQSSGFGATTGDGTLVYRDAPVLVLRDGAQGNLDASDWFLDLDSTAANTPHSAVLPRMVAVTRAALAERSLSLDAGINFRVSDNGRKVGTYILGYVPPSFLVQPPVTAALAQERIEALVAAASPVLVQLTPAGWTTVDGLLVPFTQGAVSGNGAPEVVLNGVDPTAIPGARFCIGYGEDGGSMLAAGSITEVIATEPAAAPASSIPCVTPGVYLDGPPASAVGSAATFQVTVVGNSPTGTVRLTDGFTFASAPLALSATGGAAARASASLPALSLGRHAIGAIYSGDSGNASAAAALPLLHVVSAPFPATSTVNVSLWGPASAVAGAESTFTAMVIGNQPAGTVQFRDSGGNLAAPVPIIGGVATLRIATLSPGLHTLSAFYFGDARNSTRVSDNLPHLVGTTPALEIALSASTYAPLVGTPVTLTAAVESAPSIGTVQFFDRGLALGGPLALSAGKARLTLATLASGSHLLTALYERDAFNRASSAPLVLDVALALDPAHPEGDADGDGIPNPVEVDLGRNPFAMDNDIFKDARLFAMQQYRDFLGREGDPGGINYWSNQVASGALSRSKVVEAYFSSPEFQGTVAPVVRLYFAYFLRIPDYAGLGYWIDQYRGGRPLQSISDFFATSPEFLARYGTLNNASFVQLVYNNVLGRQPDNPGLSFWIGQLNSGALTRGAVMTGFSESAEYRGLAAHEVYVTMMYIGMLRRAPESDGFSYWVTYLDQDHSGLALIDGFLASPEYRGRFLP